MSLSFVRSRVATYALALLLGVGAVAAVPAPAHAWGTKCNSPKRAKAAGTVSSGSNIRSYGRVCVKRWRGGSHYLTWGKKPYITTPSTGAESAIYDTHVSKGPELTAVRKKKMVVWRHTLEDGFVKYTSAKRFPYRLVWNYEIKAKMVGSGVVLRYDYKTIYDALHGTRICRVSPDPKCWKWKSWS